mgnify:CR=1 FL=1
MEPIQPEPIQTEPIQPEPIQTEPIQTALAHQESVLDRLIKDGGDCVERQERVTEGRKMQLKCFQAHLDYLRYLRKYPEICVNVPKFVETQGAIISSVIQPAPRQQETAVSEPALQQNQCVFCNRTYASTNSLKNHKKTCPSAPRK